MESFKTSGVCSRTIEFEVENKDCKPKEFAEKMEELGGYTVEQPGEVVQYC